MRRLHSMVTKKLHYKTMMKRRTMKTLTKRIKILEIWSPKSKVLREKRKSKKVSLKSSPISKAYMPKLLNNSSNSTRNLRQIIITEDGFGCNFLGSVWLWNAITLTNWENVLLPQLPTCLFPNKDNLPYVNIILILEALKIALEAKKKKQAILEKTEENMPNKKKK